MNPADPFGTPKPADPWDWLAAMSRRMRERERDEADQIRRSLAPTPHDELRERRAQSEIRTFGPFATGGKR